MEIGFTDLWFVVSGTFLTGIAIGVIGFAATEHRLRKSKTVGAAYGRTGASQQPIPGDQDEADPPGVAGAATGRSPGTAADRWNSMQENVAALGTRLAALELQFSELSANVTAIRPPTEKDRTATRRALDKHTLVAAGVEPAAATAYLGREGKLEMRRLELRDRASREGWLNTDRFMERLGELEGEAGSLREAIGDESYDRFLYLTGQPNRVVIASVIDGSPAELAGVEAGDVVMDYADGRVFSSRELRDATCTGEPGANVRLRVQRDGEIVELVLPRGPLGVRLDSDSVEPVYSRKTGVTAGADNL